MSVQSRFIYLAVLLGLNSIAFAGNAALSQAAAVPAGERIANYLQAVMSTTTEMVGAKTPGDIFSPKDPYRLAFDYDPDLQVIDVYIAGKLENTENIKALFELTQKLILRLNNKIQKCYGVTLKAEDLSVDYLNVNSGKVILKMVNGQYADKMKSEAVSTPTISTTKTN